MRPKIAALLALVCLTVVGRVAPADAEPLTGVTSVGTGYYHGCAVLANTRVRCWGWNEHGAIGNGTAQPSRFAPTLVRSTTGSGPLTGVRSVVGGDYHNCALLSNGQARCWGYNESGQLGDATDDDRFLPVAVRNVAGTGNLSSIVQLTASQESTCALLRNTQVRCWGAGTEGALGNGDTSERLTPVVVEVADGVPLTGVRQVESGDRTTCAVLTNGRVRCWGKNSSGQVGDGTTERRTRAVLVRNAAGTRPLGGVRRVSVGAYHACATVADGSVRCWGDNTSGQLGDGSTSLQRHLPVPVRNGRNTGPLRGVAYVDAAGHHTCALLTGGQVRCWGEALYGELGNGRLTPDRRLPVAVRNARNDGNLRGVSQLQATSFHTCVRLRNGQARCWGFGTYGTLGDLGQDDSALPVKVLRPA